MKPGCQSRQPGRTTTRLTPTNNSSDSRPSKRWPKLKAAGYRIVAIDQHTQVVKIEQKRGWFPVNSRPRLAVSGGRKSIDLLGAVTDNGDRFVSLIPGRLTAEVAKHFLRALQHEFGRRLVIVLDNARYFTAKALEKQAGADGLLLEFLPPYSPELTPLEQCWRQLKAARANRLFLALSDVKAFLEDALPTSPHRKSASTCVDPYEY